MADRSAAGVAAATASVGVGASSSAGATLAIRAWPTTVGSASATASADAAGALYEILRPFAFTASIIPVLAGAALAWVDDLWAWAPFIAALIGAVSLHAGTNIVNEVYDVRKGIDVITSPRASHAIVKGRMSERTALRSPAFFFLSRSLVGVYLVWLRGPAIIGLGLLGLIGGWGYTAPPLEYKNHALGVPIVFLLMGPLMVEGVVLRGERPVVADGAGAVDPGRAARRGDPPRQRVARHPRGHAGPGSRRCRRGSAGDGRTTGTSRSSSARTSSWRSR